MTRIRLGGHGLAAGAVCALGMAAFAGNPVTDTVWRDQKVRMAKNAPVNGDRVRKDMDAAGAKGDVTWYVVPAMSDVMRLSDTYPQDGRFAGEVRATLAGNESEAASFQLFSFADADKVDVRLSDLTCGGSKLAADLRVVKLWFQNGNGWVSYFDDSGLKLIPELLLHDENLIKVDLGSADNYARVVSGGKESWKWLTAPKPLASRGSAFDQFDPGFLDAPTMQPVRLAKNEFKQFFITARAAKGQKGGVYKGKVTVSAKGRALCEIPVAFRVLDFELPLPGAYDDPNKPYIYDCMGSGWRCWERCLRLAKGDEAKAKAAFRAWMQTLYDHSMFNAIVLTHDTPQWQIDLYREIGFPLDGANGDVWTGWFCLNFGGRMDYTKHKTAWRCAKEADEFYHKKLGMKDVRLAYGDEQGAGFIVAHRDLWDAYFYYGFGGLGFCGHAALPYKGGYNSSFYDMATNPGEVDEIRLRRNCNGRYFAFYANQHTASENPQFTRRQHGLLSYLSGMNMTYNYEFAITGFNDRENELYRPMVVAYANAQGLMETIEFAGFREGCDDIRYATAALKLADEGIASASKEAKVLGGCVRHYLATLDRETFDLNEARAELIEYILKLRKALKK